jgi:hypothetical protein
MPDKLYNPFSYGHYYSTCTLLNYAASHECLTNDPIPSLTATDTLLQPHYRRTNLTIYRCTNVTMYRRINLTMHGRTNVSMYRCSNVTTYAHFKASVFTFLFLKFSKMFCTQFCAHLLWTIMIFLLYIINVKLDPIMSLCFTKYV